MSLLHIRPFLLDRAYALPSPYPRTDGPSARPGQRFYKPCGFAVFHQAPISKMSPPPPADKSPARIANVRCRFFNIISSLIWAMPFHPMQHPPALLTDCIKKGFPHKESLRVSTVSAPLPIARGLSGRAKQAVLLARNPHAAAPSRRLLSSDRTLVHAALFFLTVAGPLWLVPNSLLSPHGHLFSIQFYTN